MAGLSSGKVGLRPFTLDAQESMLLAIEDGIPALQANAFRPFDEADTRAESIGWVSINEHYKPILDGFDVNVSRYMIFTMRRDQRKVPKDLLNEECRKLEEDWKQRFERDRLSRAERDEIKEIITQKYIQQALPTTHTVDVVLDVEAKRAILLSPSKWAADDFASLMIKTFSVKALQRNDEWCPEFLAFLWSLLEANKGKISALLNGNEGEVWLEDKLSFDDGADNRVAVVCNDVVHSIEAAYALADMQVVKAGVGVSVDNQVYRFTLALEQGERFVISGAQLPALPAVEEEEDPEANFQARIAQAFDLLAIVAALFKRYELARSEKLWPQTLKEINLWATARKLSLMP